MGGGDYFLGLIVETYDRFHYQPSYQRLNNLRVNLIGDKFRGEMMGANKRSFLHLRIQFD